MKLLSFVFMFVELKEANARFLRELGFWEGSLVFLRGRGIFYVNIGDVLSTTPKQFFPHILEAERITSTEIKCTHLLAHAPLPSSYTVHADKTSDPKSGSWVQGHDSCFQTVVGWVYARTHLQYIGGKDC